VSGLATIPPRKLRRGIELGFFNGSALVYDGTEPVAIDAQAGKGKLARFLGINLVSPRTAHLTKIITDPKDAELAWVSWKTLARQGYKVRFINPDMLYGYPGDSYNINTRVLEVAAQPFLRGIIGQAAYDAASFLVPLDPDSKSRWIGQGVRTMFAHYNRITALYPSERWTCSPGGLWDFFGRGRAEIQNDLLVWAADSRMQEEAGMSRLIASLTDSLDQWNAYFSVIVERLQAFQPGYAARTATETNSFDPAEMKSERTALFIIGSARSDTSRHVVGAMAAAIIFGSRSARVTFKPLKAHQAAISPPMVPAPTTWTWRISGSVAATACPSEANFLSCSRRKNTRIRFCPVGEVTSRANDWISAVCMALWSLPCLLPFPPSSRHSSIRAKGAG